MCLWILRVNDLEWLWTMYEVVDSRKKHSNMGLVCKLDIEKAHDHVNQEFFLLVLENMGIGYKWQEWIHFSISSVRMVVIVNDTRINFFLTFRGLR